MRVAPSGTRGPEQRSRVVVGTDGSSWGREALGWAARHAGLIGADLDVWWSGGHDDVLDRVASRYPRLGLRVHETDVDPVRALISASRDAKLLVIGYRGRSGHALGLGGAVLPLVRDARCDTVVVRGRPSAVRGEHHRVTALVSGADADEEVLAHAVTAALDRGAELRVVHAVPLPVTNRVLDADHRFVLDNASRLLDKLDRRPPDSLELLRVHPHEAVVHQTDTDLVVVGGGRGTARDRCGGVTRSALHHAPSPVLVVHGRVPVQPRPAPTALPSARTSPDGAVRPAHAPS